ncbi:flagellar biosynthesis anti-sigma factor FlgM [Desertibacillus haloalkaliphilus]|uniref:flagellar biosynthesis anti-sigma factor FlgM n=1 Tax=Desertibacillus haloalkaliphilus TaxID=1328930 RepID=UPI001C25BE00|nr:flagellar biosynthesis anti-sigma factor FlgM [Desertibacillus haloalkaliphilus]MBU8905985.1 flagellar biosynthesis anti-sigma factor FlgM [Desertibacillus haloalkaliphilus]
MKINPYHSVQNNPYRKQVSHQQMKTDAVKQRDKVEISPAAKQMQQVSKIETERQEKVEALKEKIASGDYKVDPEAIARKVYDFWSN